MGNLLTRLRINCSECFKRVRDTSPRVEDKNNKIIQLVDLDKNPSSEMSQIID